jgi:hypothetical protein
MRTILAELFLTAAILLLSLAPGVVTAKVGRIGRYAVVNEVTFDQTGPSPNTIRISGVFVLPVSQGNFRSEAEWDKSYGSTHTT